MNAALSSLRQILLRELLTASPNPQDAEVSSPRQVTSEFWVPGRKGCCSGHCDDSSSIMQPAGYCCYPLQSGSD